MKILMRGYADPFKTLTATTALHRRVIGQNSGNLVFAASAQRALMTRNNEVTLDVRCGLAGGAEEINEKYDAVVFPLANAFRPDFTSLLSRYTDFIKKLTIPVTVLGIGAQASLDYDWSDLDSIAGEVKAFVGTILDHGPSIGVRGECTAAYLNSLGFTDVDIIGCPSMFLHGNKLRIDDKPVSFTKSTRIALNLTPNVDLPEHWVLDHLQRHPATTYIGQDSADLKMMLGGSQRKSGNDNFPGNVRHPFVAKNKMKLYLNASTWIDEMRSYDFSFGTRIHGNVVPLLAGVPSHVIAHDSRTLELARYFEIPHTLSPQLNSATTARQLFEESDFSKVQSGHEERFERFVGFIDKHGLEHIHQTAEEETDFDQRVKAATIGPESVVTPWSQDLPTISERIWQSTNIGQYRTHELEAKVEDLSKTVHRLQRELDETRSSQNFAQRIAARIKR